MPDILAYRAFAWNRAARDSDLGGCLHVSRAKQGAGRHDSPADYGIYYCAASEESAIAEHLQEYRGQVLTPRELIKHGHPLAIVEIKFEGIELIDLDEPLRLEGLKTLPSIVASSHRPLTQDIAKRIFASKADAIGWWSTLNSLWANYSVFTKMEFAAAKITRGPELIGMDRPSLLSAAKRLGVRI